MLEVVLYDHKSEDPMPMSFEESPLEERFKDLPDDEGAWNQQSHKHIEAPKPSNMSDSSDDPSEIVRYESVDQLEAAFKKGDFAWPKNIEVKGIKFTYYKSNKRPLVNVFRDNQEAYIIYHIPKQYEKQAVEAGMGHWMVFLFRPTGPTTLGPTNIGFTSAARGGAMYENANVQTIGDVVLLKIHLPSGVIALKGKVDTGAEISSLHVDDKPRIVGDTVRFQNHNASGNIISAPMVSQQAVKSSDGGTEYRPVIELDIEVEGKPISKAQFNLNNRSHMEHQVLIGQNVLEKTGFLVDPNKDEPKQGGNVTGSGMQEDEEEDSDLYKLTEEQIEEMVSQLAKHIEDNTED